MPTADDIMIPDDNLEKAQKHDITPDSLFAELKAELKAQETKFFQKEGIVTDQRDVIAWNTRQGALEKAFRLLNMYPAEKADLKGGITVNINATPIEKED